MIAIPALDLREGACVQLVGGEYTAERVRLHDPVRVLQLWEKCGFTRAHVVDLDAATERGSNAALVRDLVVATSLETQVGGGVRSVADVRRLLNAGADKVSFNSAAVARPELIREASDKYGAQCIVVAIDAKRQAGGGWHVYTHGGRKDTGLDAVAWATRMAELGAGEILLTSMDRDGTKIGFDLELTRAVSDAVPVPVIASGGVGALEHLSDGIRVGRADAVLAASIFHYGEFTVGQAKALLARDGIPVRL